MHAICCKVKPLFWPIVPEMQDHVFKVGGKFGLGPCTNRDFIQLFPGSKKLGVEVKSSTYTSASVPCTMRFSSWKQHVLSSMALRYTI